MIAPSHPVNSRPMETGIPGVTVRPLARHTDPRGWLVELYRDDELPDGFRPAMGYLSVTHPGVERGPHEHVGQCDGFVFLSGRMELALWENRPGAPAAEFRHVFGEDEPAFVTVPPGVVHGYRNVGEGDAMVLNFPDALYAGWDKSEPVDEIRHERDPESRFKF